MRSKSEMKRMVCDAIDRNRDRITLFGDSIADEPELGYKEFKTAKKYMDLLDTLGYPYRSGIARTGVVSRIKGRSKRLSVAVMAEMDALIVPGHPKADPITGAAHCCGHNCMMAALSGVTLALRETGIMDELDGDVVLMAIPAEEYVEIEYRNMLRERGDISFLGGKQEFIRLGEFDDVDMAVMQHVASSAKYGKYKAGAGSTCNGFVGKLVRYVGREAHAGGAPFEGINALNAAMLGLMAIHAQRETFRDEDHIRVHPIITKGGDLVNIVPADVRMETYVRGANTDAILDASAKVDRALKSGGDAVGAETIITNLPGYLPAILNDGLTDLMTNNLVALFGEDRVERMCPGFGGGSTDEGDVSHLIPAIQAYFAGASGNLHSETYDLSDKETAYIMSAKALSMMLIDLLADGAETGLEIKRKFVPAMTRQQYLRDWGGLDV